MEQPEDWLEITRQIREGNTTAFEIFYLRHFDLMLSIAKRLTSYDEHRAMDIVQDAMLKAIRRMKVTHDVAALRGWVVSVVTSVAYDALRSELSRANRERRTAKRNVATSDTLDELTARLVWIESQLVALPREQRELIDLRYRLGWSLRQIGQHLGLKVGTVDGKIRRIVSKLRVEASTNEE